MPSALTLLSGKDAQIRCPAILCFHLRLGDAAMTIFSGASGASLWLADAWTSYRSSLLSRSAGPSVQDLLDQGAATANALASISQDRTTGLASIVLQVAQARVQAQIKALK